MQINAVTRTLRAAFPALLLSGISMLPLPSSAQGGPPAAADAGIDAAQRKAVIDALTRQLDANYLYPDQAKKIDEALHRHDRHGDDDGAIHAQQFADLLTTQMQQVVPDKHLYVMFSDDELPPDNADGKPSAEQHAMEVAQFKAHNFGIDRVERLPFNIGYLNLEVFLPANDAGEALTAAMNLLANTDALIIDLRGNHGGDQNTVALVASYLFDGRTHLNDFYYRKGDRLEQMWTSEYVPGPRYGQGKDVYILTDKESYSGAEDFAYDLQNLKRAVVIGETTAGAAHCGDMVRLDAHFSAMVPDCRGINPVTKGDWEGSGVKPDIAVAAADALRTAQVEALKKMKAAEKSPARVKKIDARIAQLQAVHGDEAAP